MFRFACSVVLWGAGGHYKQMSLACVGSARSVPATLGLPLLMVCVLSLSTMLRLQVALQGVGPELRALRRPKRLRFRFLGTQQRHRLSWVCVLCLPCPRSSGIQELDERTLPGYTVPYPLRGPSLIFSALVPCTLCLCWEADFWLRPSQWMSTIQNLKKSLVRDWKPVCSLVRDAVEKKCKKAKQLSEEALQIAVK